MPLFSRKPEIATLQNCEDEPIRIPGAIQPHGVLLCLDRKTECFTHVSANIEHYFGIRPESIVGESIRSLAGLCGSGAADLLEILRRGVPTTLDKPGIKTVNGLSCSLRILPQSEYTLLEILPVQDFLEEPIDFGLIHSAASVLRKIDSLDDFCNAAAEGFREISGYDRVMVYHFDSDGSGEVLSEAKRSDLPTYLGMRYPASDIPKQARKLYLENHVRIIPDVNYEPVDLLQGDESVGPADLGQAQLRSVSPLHVEYLNNMGVGATLTISIVVKDVLVGLIACHHYSPKYLHHRLLILCEYFGQAFSLQFGNRIEEERLERSRNYEALRSQLADAVRSLEPVEVVAKEGARFLEIASADGLAFCQHGEIVELGKVPQRKWIERFRVWAIEKLQGQHEFLTDEISSKLDGIDGDLNGSAGLLAVNLGGGWENAIVWFRTEKEWTVDWAGKPDKLNLTNEDGIRLSPRKSFDLWRETIKGRSLPWDPVQVQNAVGFARYDLALTLEIKGKNKANAMLQQLAAELQRSNGDLTSFAYAASHDLQEPLRAVAGCLQILQKRSGDKFEAGDQKLFRMAIDGAHRMQRLVSDLLAYSRLNTQNDIEKPVDSGEELEEAILRLDDLIRREGAKVTISGEMPIVNFSSSQLTTVFQNLIGNALKFRGKEAPVVDVKVREGDEDTWVFSVSDNGIGIGAEYLEDVFAIFARLHTQEKYEGSGIGLSVCRKIIERHGGRIWVESSEGEGSVFTFALKGEKPQSNSE